MSATTYYEDGSLVFLAVDTAAALRSGEEWIFPLGFMLVNKGRDGIRVHSENVRLRDAAGNWYPLVPYETFRKEYRRQAIDRRVAEGFVERTNQRLGIDRSSSSTYFGDPLPFYGEQGARADWIEVGRRRFTRGYLYFPVPQDGLRDQLLELHVESDSLPDPVFVKFRVR